VRVLVVNAGSSSLKLRVLGSDDELLGEHDLDAARSRIDEQALLPALDELPRADAVGHRIVHGGERFRDAVRVDPEVTAALHQLTELAPLAAGHAGRRVLRHRVPRDAAGSGGHLRAARRAPRTLRRAPLRLSWPVARLRDAAGSGARA
jgi:acetate kinase